MARPRLVPLAVLKGFKRSPERKLRMDPGIAKLREKAPDLVPIYRAGSSVFPEVNVDKVCQLSKGKAGLRPCHVELVFVGARQSERKSVPPGTYLRFCSAQKDPGKLIPVKDHADANAKAAKYCACAKGGDSERRASCATKAGAVDATNTAPPRKRRR